MFRARAAAPRDPARPVYDLVFMDVSMPVLDGLEATRRIRAAEAELAAPRRTPVCACTAFATDEDREAAFAAGMDDFCPKPVMRAAVLKVVDRLAPREPAPPPPGLP
eukprot:tig00001249_g7787.t1